jgi:C-terminal processing protease CtpA/Prc
MKRKHIAWLIIPAVVAAGALLYIQNKPEPAPEVTPVVAASAPAPPPAPEPVEIKPEPKPEPEPVAVVETNKPVQEIIIKATPPPAIKTQQEQRLEQQKKYWAHVQTRFLAKMDQLAREKNPQRRQQLIRQIAQYVRMDTLATLDWIATLNSPEEQKLAMEELNKHALVGIGARIEKDQTGLPAIRDTTLLGAIETSGQVQKGDHIAGVIGADGKQIDFYDLSMKDIVTHLRGEAGTEVELVVMRNGIKFNVTVDRSMIVMEPMF